jgi:hypothetical protein
VLVKPQFPIQLKRDIVTVFARLKSGIVLLFDLHFNFLSGDSLTWKQAELARIGWPIAPPLADNWSESLDGEAGIWHY